MKTLDEHIANLIGILLYIGCGGMIIQWILTNR
jgi:hypothetical protein